MTSQIDAYYAPGACSRVMLHALETIGLPYQGHPLALMRGEQMAPAYRTINPRGKVPALRVDGSLLTENAAIAFYLATGYPEAELLPDLDDPLAAARGLSDLIWCGGTLHPMVRRMVRPQLFGDDTDAVRRLAHADFAGAAAGIEAHVAEGRWWYGDAWSLVDTYIFWIGSIARLAGYPLDDHPGIVDHGLRLTSLPSFRRVVSIEKAAVADHDIPLPPNAVL